MPLLLLSNTTVDSVCVYAVLKVEIKFTENEGTTLTIFKKYILIHLQYCAVSTNSHPAFPCSHLLLSVSVDLPLLDISYK